MSPTGSTIGVGPRSRRSPSSRGRSTSSSSTPTRRTTSTTSRRRCPSSQRPGLILADNTLASGRVVVDDPGPMTENISEFNDHVREDERVESVLLTIRDGVTMIRSTAAGLSSRIEARTLVGERQHVVGRGERRVRDRDDAHPGGVRRADAARRVLDRGASRRRRRRVAAPPRGRRPARACRAPPPPTRPWRGSSGASPDTSSARSISSRLDDEASPSGHARGQPLDRLDRAVDQRQPPRVAVEHPPDDLAVDLLRRLGQARRPRACSGTTPSSSSPSCPPAPASLQRPPRSRTRPSRTSSQSSSVSTMTPSRSKTTACDRSDAVDTDITSNREVPLSGRRARARRRRAPRLEHLADEDRVVAGVVLGPDRGTRASRARPRRAGRAPRPRGRPRRSRARPAGCRCGRSAARAPPGRSRGGSRRSGPRGGSARARRTRGPTEIPTSGGSSESETSEPTVGRTLVVDDRGRDDGDRRRETRRISFAEPLPRHRRR